MDRQRARGLPEPWLEQIPGFLDSVLLPPQPTGSRPPGVLLHTEFMRGHLTIDEDDDWRLTGRVAGQKSTRARSSTRATDSWPKRSL